MEEPHSGNVDVYKRQLKTTAIRESFSCKKKAKYSNDRFLINRFKQNDYTFSLKRLYVFIKTIILFHQNGYTFLVNRALLSCCTVLFSFGKRSKSAWLQGYSDNSLWTKLPDLPYTDLACHNSDYKKSKKL